MLGLLFRRIGLPQVLGFIIAGIVVGPAIFGELCGFSLIGLDKGNGAEYTALFLLNGVNAEGGAFSMGTDGLAIFSKIGVLLLMFSTGLETNLKELKNTGLAAILIACMGVVVPLVLGAVALSCASVFVMGLMPQNFSRSWTSPIFGPMSYCPRGMT